MFDNGVESYVGTGAVIALAVVAFSMYSTVVGSLDTLLFKKIFREKSFFQKGWGNPLPPMKVLQEPMKINKMIWVEDWKREGPCMHRHGYFMSPILMKLEPGEVPIEVHQAHFQMVIPADSGVHGSMDVNDFPEDLKEWGVVLHISATGDVGYGSRRTNAAIPLLKHRIISILPQLPYYGHRKPSTQHGVSIESVRDQGVMVASAIEEGRALVRWCKESGFKGTLGAAGMSFGGAMASCIGLFSPTDISITSFVSPDGGAAAFTDSVFTRTVDLATLAKEKGFQSTTEANLHLRQHLNDYMPEEMFPLPSYKLTYVQVAARNDWFVPLYSTKNLEKRMSARATRSEIRWIKGGHLSSIRFKQPLYVEAVLDSFKMMATL